MKMRRYASDKIRRTYSTSILAILILASLSTALLSSTPSASAQGIVFYADVIKYPLPSVPEAVLDGDTFKVQVKLGPSTVWQDATVFNELASATATLLSAEYSPQTELWDLEFDLSPGLREGTYSITLSYRPSETEPVEAITQPRCLWILPEWPQRLRVLACGDVKPEAGGLPYWEEMSIEANLIDPDVILFLGDLVNVPTLASEWIRFDGPFSAFVDPVYVTAGNHEYTSPGKADIYKRIMGPVNYTATIGNFLLMSLDTDLNGWITMDRLSWAEQVLKANPDKTKIIIFHYCLFNEEELKPRGEARFDIASWEDFDSFLDEGIVFPTWAAHPEEAKELFRLIVEYDVRLIMYEHIHTDLTVIVQDTTTGSEHYFVSPAALAFDIPDHDYRGFKLIDIYANGTVDESTLYYNGTAMFDYPNSIPIDSGTTVHYQPIEPYKIGLLEYYYTPANDGQHHAVSLKVNNELNQRLYNPRIIFRLPADRPMSAYEWLPYEPDYEAIEKDGVYCVVLKDTTVPVHSELSFTVKAVDDTEDPSLTLTSVPESVELDSWLIFNAEAVDQGWGVNSVVLIYSIDGENWVEPDLLDLTGFEDGKVEYKVWIKAPAIDTILTIKGRAVDFAGRESVEATAEVAVGTPTPPSYTLTVESSPISSIAFSIDDRSLKTPYTETLEKGEYTITVPEEVEEDGITYVFSQWEDGKKDTTRTIDLSSDAALTAIYRGTPAEFTVSSLRIKPSSVETGGTVSITAECANTGGQPGDYTVTLKIDGDVKDEEEVTLSPGEDKTVSFSVSATEQGTFSVDVKGLTGSYSVTKPAGGGIPGFPYESIMLGLLVGVLLLWLLRQRS